MIIEYEYEIEKIKRNNKFLEKNLLDLGRAVPKANTLREGDWQLRFSQVDPFKKAYYGGGTGNQNYLASITFGLNDFLMIEGFYSHSDEPLQEKIAKYDDAVSNRWISYGSSLTWRFIALMIFQLL